MVTHLSTPVLVYGRDYRLYDYNEQAGCVLNIDPTDVGEDIREVLAKTPIPEPASETDGNYPEILDETRISILDDNGESRHFFVQVSPLASGGVRELGYTIQLSDITEQHQQRQRLEDQNDRLEKFTSVISHDLRNPLTVASGRVRMAQEEYDSEHLAAAARAHDRMEALISDLLTLAKEGKTVEEMNWFSLAELSETCWNTMKTNEATLVTHGDPIIKADRERLRRLLENLIRNAIEHGGDDITVTIGELEAGFYMADDGTGIPEADHTEIFERGYTNSSTGTGFGLAIVEEIANAHEWNISITESTDGGARFEFSGVDVKTQ